MRNRVSFNVSEKERLRKDEEEQRKKQLAYDQQVNEKRAQLRKDFELSKQIYEQMDNQFTYDVKESEFKKELDRLISFNESKKQNLNKMLMRDRNYLNISQEIRSSSMETNSNFFKSSNYVVGQENQIQKTQENHFLSTNYSLKQKQRFENIQDCKEQSNFKSDRQSKYGFQQSCYRSQSMQFISQKDTNDVGKLQEHIEEVNILICVSEENILNENEKYQQITKMNKELTQTINQFKEKVSHLMRMNEIADQRYKNIYQIEFQANEDKIVYQLNQNYFKIKRLVNQNVDQAKEKITNIQRVYKQYREKKYNISQQLKKKNEQDEIFLSTVQIKIEDCTKQNEMLEKEIAKLDQEKHKQEKREKESYFVGLYLWSFEEIEKIFLKGQTDNIIKNYYEIEQQNMNTPKNIKDSNHQNETNNQEKQGEPSVALIFSQATSQVILGAPHQVQNSSTATINQNQSRQNLLESKNVSPSKNQKSGIRSSQYISSQSNSPLRVSRRLNHKSIRLLDSVTVRYLDDYEVEPPNFDRKEILEKIHQFYFEHHENIEPTINQIMMFYKNQLMHCLLLKNQGEELIQQKKLNTLRLQKLEEEINILKKNNFFLSSISQEIIETNFQNQVQSSSPEINLNTEQSLISKSQTQVKFEIVQNLLKENISMDSGFISKFQNGQVKKVSTLNVEKFIDQHKQNENLEEINEKNQKFIFQCYLNVVELMERICLIVPLIDFKIEQLQQKANMYFDFDYISHALLKNCSELFELVTNGKSLEKEFQRTYELVIGANIFQQTGYSFNREGVSSFNNNNIQSQQSQLQLSFQNLLQQSSYQNNQKSTLLALPNSTQSTQFNGILPLQNSNGQSQINVMRQNYKSNKKTSQQFSQQLSYLNLDELFPGNPNSNSSNKKVDDDQLQPPQINFFNDSNKQQQSIVSGISQQFYRQSTQEREKEKNVDKLCEEILKDKMARYMLHEQFIKQYIGKMLEFSQEITVNEVLIQIKSEALRLLNEKLNLIFKTFQNVHSQIFGSIHQISRQLLERNVKIKTQFYGPNQPPPTGGVLSLPKNDFIIQSYMNAFDKHRNYLRSEDEDWMQKFSRTSFNDRNTLIINSNNTSLNQINGNQDQNKKNGIYSFIHEISERKTKSCKSTAPLPSQSAYINSQNNNSVKQNNIKNNNQNNNVNTPVASKQSNVNLITFNSHLNDVLQINSAQQNTQDFQNCLMSDNVDKNLIKIVEENFIDHERKNMKIVEKKDYEILKYKDMREKERFLQEEKKKRIVYHRLNDNGETENTRQEKTAIKQFSIDQDILFKISKIENREQSAFTEKLNETIKQESSKINSKFAKEFSKIEHTYLKTNALYNLRRDLNLKEREDFLKQDIQHKYYMSTSNDARQSKSSSQRELKQQYLSLSINTNINEPIKLIHKRKNNSTNNIMAEIMNSKLQENNINAQQSQTAYPSKRNKQKPFQQINKLLQRTQFNDQTQSDRQSKQFNSYFTPKLYSSTKYSNTSTDDLSRFQSININQFGSNFQNNSTLLVQNNPSPSIQAYAPNHYKYQNPDWIQQLSHTQQAINSLTNIYLPKNSSIIRKAFTSQTEKRHKTIK